MGVQTWGGNFETWVQSGQNAARAGRTGEALASIVSLLSLLCHAAVTIARNQRELETLLTRLLTEPRR